MIEKIISGGQTGVDRAALDVAMDLGIPYGGWCPKDRLDETGIIPEKYTELKEVEGTFTSDKVSFDKRTSLNIKDSDGTLILIPSIPIPQTIKDGTILTIEEVLIRHKPYLVIDLSRPVRENAEAVAAWVREKNISILNVAGPRESSSPGIYKLSAALLNQFILQLQNQNISALRARL